jgi:hypothetical protein
MPNSVTDDTQPNITKDITEALVSSNAPHCVISIPNRVLEIADTCFEVFSSKELKNSESILPELVATYPDLSSSELLQSINLALAWKRQLRRARGKIQ